MVGDGVDEGEGVCSVHTSSRSLALAFSDSLAIP